MTQEHSANITVNIDISAAEYTEIISLAISYLDSFKNEDQLIQMNFDIKRDHTKRVAEIAEVIAKSIDSNDSEIYVAQICALLHDFGRFEQFKQFKTFNDSVSFDHGEYGEVIIREINLLESIKPEIAELICKVVKYHNKATLPKNETNQVIHFCKIIRDADKLDILDQAVIEYTADKKKRNSSFSLNLKDSPSISEKVTQKIINGKTPDKDDLETINDFKLLQMCYVFDLNFKKSFVITNQKQHLKNIFDTLPKSDQVFELLRKARIHVENQLN